MDTPERRQRQRESYLRMRDDPVKVERYRQRKRKWAQRRKMRDESTASDRLRDAPRPAKMGAYLNRDNDTG